MGSERGGYLGPAFNHCHRDARIKWEMAAWCPRRLDTKCGHGATERVTLAGGGEPGGAVPGSQ